MEADSLQTGIVASAVLSAVMQNVPGKELVWAVTDSNVHLFHCNQQFWHTVQYSVERHSDASVYVIVLLVMVFYLYAHCVALNLWFQHPH